MILIVEACGPLRDRVWEYCKMSMERPEKGYKVHKYS